jgi:hypothetical protein
VVYRFVCEPCRQSLGLNAERPYLNKIRREADKIGPQVVQRDSAGKPWMIGRPEGDCFVATNSTCCCACASNDHDPYRCIGVGQFKIGGRPGSGVVDKMAEQLGREPIPELVVAQHEDCEVLVTSLLAWWFGSSDDERVKLEVELVR